MKTRLPDNDVWLRLSEAAQQLGVHPATVRRWADDGSIPVMVTPGGHRRFALTDIRRFVSDQRRAPRIAALGQLWAEAALAHTRAELAACQGAPWLATFDREDRVRHRLRGRKLIMLMQSYVVGDKAEEAIKREALVVGREMAEDVQHREISLVTALEIALFFRDKVFEALLHLPGAPSDRPDIFRRLLRRNRALLDMVQLAIVEAYDQRAVQVS